jgi:hypothetical protein
MVTVLEYGRLVGFIIAIGALTPTQVAIGNGTLRKKEIATTVLYILVDLYSSTWNWSLRLFVRLGIVYINKYYIYTVYIIVSWGTFSYTTENTTALK